MIYKTYFEDFRTFHSTVMTNTCKVIVNRHGLFYKYDKLFENIIDSGYFTHKDEIKYCYVEEIMACLIKPNSKEEYDWALANVDKIKGYRRIALDKWIEELPYVRDYRELITKELDNE